ncbi:acetyl-CoA hydrolase/transferase C-terminal domain-containing protein [Geobacter sp. AOG1]|uniref:acetyl-CoA hydrolase/transferase C-terminal domain-containing protein n=1 Tax=Geobacter sp. AOG1 TaxID=1566346 RepID=UPI001EE62444|nr:acetyl-CoA hydrolase/transferase C-terminal domain-containing protein [Geobacter sp. AOG1]
MDAEETIPLFKNGMYLGFSGFAEGNPKAVPAALADYVERNGLVGKMRFNVFTGASIGIDVDDRWTELGMIDRRWPHQQGDSIRKAINAGEVNFGDRHLGMYAQDFGYGFFTLENNDKLDIGVIEASCITEDGSIVPTLSVGIISQIVERAEKIIIEINTRIPSLEGIHDCLGVDTPPNKRIYPIQNVQDRIGLTSIPCDSEKIVAIVESRKFPLGRLFGPYDEKSEQIATHIVDFLKAEVRQGRLPKNLLPLQSGVGTIANAVFGGLLNSPFEHLTVWTEVFQDILLDLFDSGKLDYVSAASFAFSEDAVKRLFANWDTYSPKIVLRPSQITNHAEVIRRLGLIAMNTPIEFDIYGHVNSSIVNGSRIINGLGGSGDFMRNAYLSIMHTPSTRPSKSDPNGISCVVPMVSHVDHTEHDLDILVTEQGLADLRGLAPRQRAQRVIDTCVHPEYKPVLQDYYDRALRTCLASNSAHEPQMLYKVFNMYKHLEEKGTMKVANWD